MEISEEVWIIVSKDRKVIAKGVPRNRRLVKIDDKKDKKRILTYASKNKAESAFNDFYFYTYELENGEDYEDPESLEAVKATMTIKFD